MDDCFGWWTPVMGVVALCGLAVMVYMLNWSIKGLVSYNMCKSWEDLHPEVVGDQFAKAYPSAKYTYHDIQKGYAKNSMRLGALFFLINLATSSNVVMSMFCVY